MLPSVDLDGHSPPVEFACLKAVIVSEFLRMKAV